MCRLFIIEYYIKEGIQMKTYEEKLQELLDNKEATPIEWSQSNKDKKNGYTETEVTFKYKIKTPEMK